MNALIRLTVSFMLGILVFACGSATVSTTPIASDNNRPDNNSSESNSSESNPSENKPPEIYRLGTGDLIRIEIIGETMSIVEIRLDESGVISYSQLPDPILVKGKTITELKTFLLSKLQPDYYKNPNLQISITEYRPFFIQGQVNNPGAYPYQPGLNIMKAIALAGGLTERAGKITITRGENIQISDVDSNAIVKPDDMVTINESFF